MEFLKKQFKTFVLISLTLGLAPFNPPHIWGKLQWIAGGGAINGEQPMKAMDWFDLLFHGLPWVLLIISGFLLLLDFVKKNQKLKAK